MNLTFFLQFSSHATTFLLFFLMFLHETCLFCNGKQCLIFHFPFPPRPQKSQLSKVGFCICFPWQPCTPHAPTRRPSRSLSCCKGRQFANQFKYPLFVWNDTEEGWRRGLHYKGIKVSLLPTDLLVTAARSPVCSSLGGSGRSGNNGIHFWPKRLGDNLSDGWPELVVWNRFSFRKCMHSP